MRLLPFLFFLFPFLLAAQTEAWTAVAFEHEISEQWGYVVDLEHRRSLVEEPEATYLFLLAGNRNLRKNLNLTFGGRLEPMANGEAATFRIFTDLNYKIPLGTSAFTLESRLRYQRDYQKMGNGVQARVAVRPRIGLTAKLSDRFKLIAEYEGRFRFDERNEWSRVRYTAGLDYVASDQVTFELFWRQEDRINQQTFRSDTIFGFYVDYTLPDRRDRKWDYRHPFGRSVTW